MYEDDIEAVLPKVIYFCNFYLYIFKSKCTDLEVVLLCLELLGAAGHVLEDGRQGRVDPRPITAYTRSLYH